ncbi:MAG TPA: hypothetical protein VGJ59_12175 [Jatrophihabitantaceae bacterium]
MNQNQASGTSCYLHVMAQYENGAPARRWNIYQLRDEPPPRIMLVASIASCDEARRIAAQGHTPLRIAERAWQQMLAAGVAPRHTPKDVTIA